MYLAVFIFHYEHSAAVLDDLSAVSLGGFPAADFSVGL